MNLVGLHIDGYGILYDLTLTESDLHGAPVVVYGLNEAGKSTLVSFIRGVFFGFKAEGNKPEPVRGGQTGGWLLVEDGGEVFRVQRTGKGDGRVVVDLPDGTKEGEVFLRSRLLRGISPTFFKNVFAIGLDELRRIDDLKKEEVSSYIYGAGTGVKPEKLAQAAGILSSSLLLLFNPHGRAQKPEINKILSDLDQLDRKIRKLEQQPEQYWQLRAEQGELEERQQLLLAERRRLQGRLGRLENLQKARDPWLRRQSLHAQLAAQEPIESFPEDGVSRLEKLEERRTGKRELIRRCELAIAGLQEKLRALAVEQAVLEQGAAIRSLDGERSLYAEKLQKLAEEEARARYLEEQVREQLADLGPSWEMEAVLALDLSLAVRRKVEDYERALRSQEEEARNAARVREACQKEVDEKRAAFEEINGKLAALPAAQENPLPLKERFAALEQLGHDWQRQVNLQVIREGQQERYNDLRLRKDFVEKSLQAAPPKEPVWIYAVALLLGLAGLFAVGPGAAGFFLLAGAAALAVLTRLFLRRLAAGDAARREQLRQEAQALAQEMQRVQDRLDHLEGELKAIARRIRETAPRLGLAEDFTSGDLLRVRRELEREEREQLFREELQKQKEKAGQALAGALESLERATQAAAEQAHERDRLAEEWRSWCRARNLPATSPVDLISFISLAEKAKETIKKLTACRNEYAQVEKYVDNYVERINAVARILGREAAARETAGDYVMRLRELLEEEEKKAAAVEQFQKELEKAIEEKEAAAAELAEIENSLQELLAAGRAKDAEEFRALAGQFARQQKLKQDAAALEEQLLLIAGSPEELAEMECALAGATEAEIEEESEQAREQLELTEGEINRLKEELAEKKLRREQMESGEELALARQEKSMLEARLLNRAREWRVRTLCAALLALAREKHERERQPGVLLQAASYLGPMTGGRYTRIIAPLGAPDQLEVEQPNGRRVGASFLSRGAAHQLYLALRLALARHCHQATASLPVILDDVMVDFDPRRLEGAVKVLGEIAAEQQVLFFTCHRHILEVIAQTLPGYKCLTLTNVQ